MYLRFVTPLIHPHSRVESGFFRASWYIQRNNCPDWIRQELSDQFTWFAEHLPLPGRIARHFMHGEQPGRSIQTADLVHEAYIKLIDVANVDWQHRAHFFAIAAQIMRRILLDRARRRVTAKRGGAVVRLNLDEAPDLGTSHAREIIELDDALNALARIDKRKAQVIEFRFFAGLSVEETAAVLNVSSDTVLRDWRLARAWRAKSGSRTG